MTTAGEPHMAAAKKVLRYLQSRKKIPLQWCALDNALPGIIHGYADASFADIPDTRKSSTGYVFLLNGGAISWRSTKTPLQAINAAEAREEAAHVSDGDEAYHSADAPGDKYDTDGEGGTDVEPTRGDGPDEAKSVAGEMDAEEAECLGLMMRTV